MRADTWTFIDGVWTEGDVPVFTARSHAAWLGSVVFDGARAFEGVAPDLLPHCARANDSARALGLKPILSAGEIAEIALDGVSRFESGAELYIRPTYGAERGGPGEVPPDPSSTRFHMCIWRLPMPHANGFTIAPTRFRRPTLDCAPVNAKAACLYPNNGRMLAEVRGRGFDNALALDALGNVAELATANVFMARDGVVATPVPNGTFLNGVTRRRVIALLRDSGVTVEERSLTLADFESADEIFATGNYGKVQPVVALERKELQPGPFFRAARELYWGFAHAKADNG